MVVTVDGIAINLIRKDTITIIFDQFDSNSTLQVLYRGLLIYVASGHVDDWLYR